MEKTEKTVKSKMPLHVPVYCTTFSDFGVADLFPPLSGIMQAELSSKFRALCVMSSLKKNLKYIYSISLLLIELYQIHGQCLPCITCLTASILCPNFKTTWTFNFNLANNFKNLHCLHSAFLIFALSEKLFWGLGTDKPI